MSIDTDQPSLTKTDSHSCMFWCRICHKQFYLSMYRASRTRQLDATCSDECKDRLKELRDERHWD